VWARNTCRPLKTPVIPPFSHACMECGTFGVCVFRPGFFDSAPASPSGNPGGREAGDKFADRPEVTHHSIPIRVDTCVDLASIRYARPHGVWTSPLELVTVMQLSPPPLQCPIPRGFPTLVSV
jgi:hypothetical protein